MHRGRLWVDFYRVIFVAFSLSLFLSFFLSQLLRVPSKRDSYSSLRPAEFRPRPVKRQSILFCFFPILFFFSYFVLFFFQSLFRRRVCSRARTCFCFFPCKLKTKNLIGCSFRNAKERHFLCYRVYLFIFFCVEVGRLSSLVPGTR